MFHSDCQVGGFHPTLGNIMSSSSHVRYFILLSGVLSVALGLASYAQADTPMSRRPQARGKNPEGEALRRKLPDSVKVVRDIAFAKYGDREVKLDLYLPKQPASDKIPAIVVIHGGGWRSGDKARRRFGSAMRV